MRAQVVVGLNAKVSALPDTTVRFTSPIEAGSLFVESPIHFAGRLDVSVVTTRVTCGVSVLLMHTLSIRDLMNGYDLRVGVGGGLACSHAHVLVHKHEILVFAFVIAGNLRVESLTTLEMDARGTKIDGDLTVDACLSGWCASMQSLVRIMGSR